MLCSPHRWGVERSFGWLARFRRLARDYERLPETLKGLHFLAFALLMAQRFVHLIAYDCKVHNTLYPTAWRTIQGYEAMHMISKGQIKGVEKGDSQAQQRFIDGLLGLVA